MRVVWNGSKPAPGVLAWPFTNTHGMESGVGFEPQRDLATRYHLLDGGGFIAADTRSRIQPFGRADYRPALPKKWAERGSLPNRMTTAAFFPSSSATSRFLRLYSRASSMRLRATRTSCMCARLGAWSQLMSSRKKTWKGEPLLRIPLA